MRSFKKLGLLALTPNTHAFPQIFGRNEPSTSSTDLALATPIPIQGSQPILKPLIPLSGSGSRESLALQNHGKLYFSSTGNEDALAPGTAARLSMNFLFPSLILDHALESYDTVKCDGSSMSLSFLSQNYYEFVKSEWGQYKEIVVITSETGCASYNDGSHHTYFKGQDLVFRDIDLALSLAGQHVELEDIIDDGHLEFGDVDHLPPEHQALRARALPKKTTTSSTLKTTSTSSKSSSLSTSTTVKVTAQSTTSTTKSTTTTTSTSSSSTTTSTSSAASGTQCGSLPSSTISGMPAASCGAGFDQILDTALGYYSFDQNNFLDTWAAIAPGADTADFYDPGDLTSPPVKRSLEARKLFSGHFTFVNAIKSIAKNVANKVTSAVQTATKIIKALPGKIIAGAKAIGSFVKALVEGHPSVSLTIPMKWHWGGVDSSPWGFCKLIHVFKRPQTSQGKNNAKEDEEGKKEAKNLLPDDLSDVPHIAIYCYQCGFNGSFKATGAIGFNLHGIYNATLDQVGNLDMSLGIGIDALAIKKIELAKKELFSVGLPGFSIPKIVSLGPVLYVQAGMSYEMKAIGQLLFQGILSFRNAKSHTDYLDSSKSYSSGWKPSVGGKVDVHGELSSALIFELPVGVMLGLDVLNGKFKKSAVSVVDTTSLEIEAKIELEGSISASTNGSSEFDGSLNDGYCTGVQWNVSLHNQLNVDLIGSKKNIKIFEVELPIAGGCIGSENPSPTAPSNPSASSQVAGPSVPGCPITGNVITNGDFGNNQLSPWYLSSKNDQNTYDTSNGYIMAVQNQGSGPYSSAWFRQNITMCTGVQYTFDFDYMFNNQPFDVYMYATLYYDDGTSQGVFGDRTYGDPAAIGQWEHGHSTFTPKFQNAAFEIGTVACNYESTIAYYDNFVIQNAPSSKRRYLEARQDDSYGSTNVQLDQSVDGTSEDNDDTPNPDNLNPYNADGSIAAPPDDSDIDSVVQSFDGDMDAVLNTDSDDYLTNLLNTYPPATTDNSTSYSPPVPDASGMIYQNLPLNDNSAQLSAADDGNIYFETVNPSSESGMFAANQGVFGGDFMGRFFHVYTSELNNLNVSRIRLSDENSFPQSGLLVGLVGVSTAGSNLMVAMDTNGGIYYLATCNLQNQNTKLFVVKDPDQGLNILPTPIASWTVTGGVASNCSLVGINPPSVLVQL